MNNLAWFKSSYSDNTGGECLEVALSWFKSSYSDNTGGDCVEVATTSTIHIRDSKTPDAPHLTVSPTTWSAFLGGLHE
ncbi:DUF397 domain-containing protein [Streptomyces sp. NBC_00078]|uniref:DUF397 domain-containing protein n=1 Tax=unclassified Streptomyces TaxID=2593676 RepID=UPI0022548239|nr:DUF397 domain-containing protein [Streptomyces sp. NBC_00078]MCX5420994.1 DUF397 domain-containing protein [Streptomyces sp. NBC_00078]